MWGCSKHWFTLPKALRDEIWRTYRPGQEITKNPSDEYLRAARAAQDWALEKERTTRAQQAAQGRQEMLF